MYMSIKYACEYMFTSLHFVEIHLYMEMTFSVADPCVVVLGSS